MSQPRPGQHRPCVTVFWPWARQSSLASVRAPPALPSIPHPSIPPPPSPSLPPTPGTGPDWALRGSGSRAGPCRAHAGCRHRGCPRARSRGSGVPPGQPGTSQARAARRGCRPVPPGTDQDGRGFRGLRRGTDAASTVHVPGGCTSCTPESQWPREGVPGLSRDCGPRAPWVVTELCLPRAPETVPGDPVTPVHPGLSRDIPGYPRSPLLPCSRSRPGPSQVIPGPTPPCAGSCRGPCRAPPAGAGACGTCTRDGGEGGGRQPGALGTGPGRSHPPG